jgi:hypothetical protein
LVLEISRCVEAVIHAKINPAQIKVIR